MKYLTKKLCIGLAVLVCNLSKDYTPRFSLIVKKRLCDLTINDWITTLKIPKESIHMDELVKLEAWKNITCNTSK